MGVSDRNRTENRNNEKNKKKGNKDKVHRNLEEHKRSQ